MTLNGGKHGLLVNAENICAAPQFATARLVGQNNIGGESCSRGCDAKCAKRQEGSTPRRGRR